MSGFFLRHNGLVLNKIHIFLYAIFLRSSFIVGYPIVIKMFN